jgi:hypothetical protein
MITIRRGVFETNSSSTHSITMCMKADYETWKQGTLYLNDGGGFGSLSDKAKTMFVTKEDIIEILTNNKYPPHIDLTELADDEFDDWLSGNNSEFRKFGDYNSEGYEDFEETFTTPNGDVVVAFGYYGTD